MYKVQKVQWEIKQIPVLLDLRTNHTINKMNKICGCQKEVQSVSKNKHRTIANGGVKWLGTWAAVVTWVLREGLKKT